MGASVDLKWLEDFTCLARVRNFSRAAEERHVTQPALSKRIQQLEHWFGVELIDRSVSPTGLTAEGKLLRQAAEEVVRTLHEQRSRLQARRQLPPTAIRIATLHLLATSFLPEWLKLLKARGVDFSPHLRVDNFRGCVQALSEGESDFLLTLTHPRVPVVLDHVQFPSICIGRDRLVAVSIPDDSGAPIFSCGNMDGRPIPLLSYTPQSFLGRLCEDVLSSTDIPNRFVVVYESELADAVKAMALTGHGLAFLPARSVREELKRGELVETTRLEADELEIRVFRSKARSRGAVERLWTLLSEKSLEL
ncbi:MAG TPA: LysR substrate-binding domain-containing protein [Beijerinckiaceae bacterium]|nr:LysR substrate-binding domain-containing protein [Beijerinckiaceae bacterium]